MSDRDSYYDKARDWAEDQQVRGARLTRTAWIIAGVAIAIALFEAVALAMLAPLKTVQPITLLVDRQTGYVQALDPLTTKRIGADAALTQSLLAQYVTAREEFDRATVANDYRHVALWSAGLARTQYLSFMPASNPLSPLQRVPMGAIVTARVKSVSPLAAGTALVRFDTVRQDRAGGQTAPQPWISVVRYRLSDGAMRFEDRLVNPLGFQVTSYRRDPEAVASAAVPNAAPVSVRPQPSAFRPTAMTAVVPERLPSAMTQIRVLPSAQVPMGSPLGVPRGAGLGAGQP